MNDMERLINIDNELNNLSKRLDIISNNNGNLKLVKEPKDNETNIIYSRNTNDPISKDKELIPNGYDEYFLKDLMFTDEETILCLVKPRELRFFETKEEKHEIIL